MLRNRSKKAPAYLVLLAVSAVVATTEHRVRSQTKPIDLGCPTDKRPRLDLQGDPLPDGAIARLGTVRLRHGHIITGIVFSGDGKSVVASDYSGGVRVWDAANGKEVRRLFTNEPYCDSLAISPDGRTLAVALSNLTVRLCDPTTGRDLGSLPRNSNQVSFLQFSHDGTRSAAGTSINTVGVWDVATQRLVHTVTLPDNVGSISFSPDDKLLACSVKNDISFWDLAQRKVVRQIKNDPGASHPLHAVFARNGGRIAVWGYEDASIRLFDANGDKELLRFDKQGAKTTKSAGDWGWAYSIFVSFSPNGKILATSRDVGRIDLWDVDRGKKLHTLAFDSFGQSRLLAFSPDGTKLAITGRDNWGGDSTIRIWDVARGKELITNLGHGAPISSVAIAPDGKTIATAGKDGIVHLWEANSGKHQMRLEAYRGRSTYVSYSNDGQRLIWYCGYGGDGTLRVWDSKTGRELSRLTLANTEAFWTAVADGGKTTYSVDLKDKAGRTYDVTTGKVTHEDTTIDFHQNSPSVVAPSGYKVVNSAGTLVNMADRKKLMEVGHVYKPTPNAWFSIDGRRLIAAVLIAREFDGRSDPSAEEISVIDPIAGKELRRFGRPLEGYHEINAAALSQDGKMTLTASADRKKPHDQVITLWETDTGRQRGRFVGHIGQINRLAISADGRMIVSVSQDTTALVWDATRPLTSRRESTAGDVAARFKDLAGENAEQAYSSMWALINGGKVTNEFLDERSGIYAVTDIEKIKRWIQDLDSGKFAERERASQELGLILDEAESHLQKARRDKPSEEALRRIDLLLQARSTGFTGKELQKLRVIEALERMASPGAIAVLKKLAAGVADATPTREAKASLERIETRAKLN